MADAFEILRRFDELPDDAITPPRVTAIVLNMNERTLRRSPPIPRIQTSPQRGGYRAGDIRAFVRGGNPRSVA
jgi:hypothetical protein